jgi:PAS domain-containing protein
VKMSGMPVKDYYTSQELLKNLIYPQDRIRLLKAFNKATKDKCKLAIDVRVVFANDSIRWINILANVLEDENVNKKSFVVTFIDITDRKNELLKLQEDDKRLNLSIDIAKIGFVDWDFKSDVVKVSGKTRQIFDLDKKQEIFQSNDIISKLHPNDIFKVRRALNLTKTEKNHTI